MGLGLDGTLTESESATQDGALGGYLLAMEKSTVRSRRTVLDVCACPFVYFTVTCTYTR